LFKNKEIISARCPLKPVKLSKTSMEVTITVGRAQDSLPGTRLGSHLKFTHQTPQERVSLCLEVTKV
jgi:hypothetical protein